MVGCGIALGAGKGDTAAPPLLIGQNPERWREAMPRVMSFFLGKGSRAGGCPPAIISIGSTLSNLTRRNASASGGQTE